MADERKRIAEALFTTLSPFHELANLQLLSVQGMEADGSLDKLVLNFGLRSLILKANADDDTLRVQTVESLETTETFTSSVDADLWKEFIGKRFGWGWVTVNQQGYLDGALLSFSGISPQILVTVVASSLKIARLTQT
jgi:hypothetical protein